MNMWPKNSLEKLGKIIGLKKIIFFLVFRIVFKYLC